MRPFTYTYLFCILLFSLLISSAHAQSNAGMKAGSVAPDAVKLEVDYMSSFFGSFAVVEKAGVQALINDKGEIVIPFNKYRFHSAFSYTDKIGSCFYLDTYYGSMVRFRKDAAYVKAIPFQEIVSGKSGYIDITGKSLFVKQYNPDGKVNFEGLPNWNGMDENGYRNLYAYTGLFTDNGLLISEKYDGSFITGKGNYAKAPNPKDPPRYINYSLTGYSWADNNSSNPAYSSTGGWTNGLRPAKYLLSDNAQLARTNEKDPVKKLEAENNSVGFINRKGLFAIKPAFYSVSEFSEGLSFVSKKNEFNELIWGAIDTTGKLVIPYTYRLHPGRFSNGLAIIRTIDEKNPDYAFINKKGEVVFKLPKNSGDTVKVTLTQFQDNDYPLHYSFDYFHFMEGYQLVSIEFKKIPGQERKYFTHLLDTAGKFIPIQQMITEKLPAGGSINIYPEIKNGQFIFSFSRALFQNGKEDAAGEYSGLGIGDINGNIIVQPVFQKLVLFEKETALQYAQQGKTSRYTDKGAEGYIDRQGIFRIIKVEKGKGF